MRFTMNLDDAVERLSGKSYHRRARAPSTSTGWMVKRQRTGATSVSRVLGLHRSALKFNVWAVKRGLVKPSLPDLF